jgi:hypothetical protein
MPLDPLYITKQRVCGIVPRYENVKRRCELDVDRAYGRNPARRSLDTNQRPVVLRSQKKHIHGMIRPGRTPIVRSGKGGAIVHVL